MLSLLPATASLQFICPSSLRPPPAEHMSILTYLSLKSLKWSMRVRAAAGRARDASTINPNHQLPSIHSNLTLSPALRTICPFLTSAAAWVTWLASNAWWDLVEGGVGTEDWVRGEVGLRDRGQVQRQVRQADRGAPVGWDLCEACEVRTWPEWTKGGA